MMKILVLGGTGTISRYAVDELIKNEYEVTIFNRGTRKAFMNSEALWKKVNVNNYAELTSALEGEYYDKVIDFTTYKKMEMRMKLSALINKCEHYVFVSSMAVYEEHEKESYLEDDRIYNSNWRYGYEKSECEDVIREYYKDYNDRYYTILRLGITWSESFIPYFMFDSFAMPGYIIYNILASKPLPLLNDGDDKIQVIYAGDFAKNLVKLLPFSEARNNVFNISGDELISSNDILEGVCKYLNKNALVSYVPESKAIEYNLSGNNIVKGGWRRYISNDKIKAVIKNYSSKVKWIDKINETVDYFYNNPLSIGWSEENDKYCKEIIGDVYEKSYVSEKGIEDKQSKIYITILERAFEAEKEKRKLIKNNMYLTKWMTLRQNNINIFDKIIQSDINEMVVYGYGVLGVQAVEELRIAGIKVVSIIDKTAGYNKQLQIQKDCVGLEDKTILISVMTAYEEIYNYLVKNGCKKIISLGEIIDKKYEGLNKYPELYKYKDISKKGDLEVICLGTTSGYYDFKFDEFVENAFNFSLPHQVLQYNYMILKNYHYKLKKGCRVIIALQYIIFLANSLNEPEDKSERYYSILPKDQVENISKVSYEEYMENVLVNSDEKIALKNGLSESELERQSIDNLESWIEQLSIISFEDDKISSTAKGRLNETKKILLDILEYCDIHGFDPVIVITPMNKTFRCKISEKFRNANFYNNLYEVVGDKYKVLDYSEDENYASASLYGGPGVLTESAAKEFTKEVLQRIGII